MHRVKASYGTLPKRLSVRFSALYLALFFVAVSLSQLFAFEKYPDIITSYDLPFDMGASLIIAAILVSCEILAIPFLLFMKLSPLMRAMSMVCGVSVLLFWLGIGLWLCSTHEIIQNIGLFGAVIPTPEGWWLIPYMVALLALYAFVFFELKHSKRK